MTCEKSSSRKVPSANTTWRKNQIVQSRTSGPAAPQIQAPTARRLCYNAPAEPSTTEVGMSIKPLSFQDVIMKLHQFWMDQGCVLWQPHERQVGAGTMQPGHAAGRAEPEPWRVGYVEPSVRPDDGRYGENPNRMQYYYQYQVILKPDPGSPQELFWPAWRRWALTRASTTSASSRTTGSPRRWARGAGLGSVARRRNHPVHLLPAGGQGSTWSRSASRITYGLERIVLALQGRTPCGTLTGTRRSPTAMCASSRRSSTAATTSNR